QVFHNLLSNAVKYAPEGGEIRVRIEDGAGGARVSVQDPGLGIPAGVLPKLFDRFYRGDADTASGAQALGLGLYITKSPVDAPGGDGLPALDELQRRLPALLLLDLMMPRMDGYAVVAEMEQRGQRPEVPVLLLTAARDPKQIAQNLHVEGFVPKPFDIDHLLG